METLKQILSDRKIASPKNLTDIVKGYGYDPEKLTADEAKLVADELGKGQLAKPPAPANGNGKRSLQPSDETLKVALLHAFSKRKEELTAFEKQLKGHQDAWVENWVNQNLDKIRNTSNDAFEMLKAELLKEEANADSFLRAADELASELFTAQ